MGERGCIRVGRITGTSALCTQGEASHFSLHGGRTISPRNIRFQTQITGDGWATDARVVHKRATDCSTPGEGVEMSRASISVSKAWRIGAADRRHFTSHCRNCRRYCHYPFDAYGPDQSRPRSYGDEYRHIDFRASEYGSVDHVRTWG